MKPICEIKLKYYPLQSHEEEFLSSLSVIIKEEGSEPWLQHIYKYSRKKLNIRLLDMLLLSLAFTYIYILLLLLLLLLLFNIIMYNPGDFKAFILLRIPKNHTLGFRSD